MIEIIHKKLKDVWLFTFSLLFVIASFGQTVEATLLESQFLPDGNPGNMVSTTNGFYFSTSNDQLWFSNGIVDDTFVIREDLKELKTITPVGESVFFFANDELYFSDKSESGTIRLTDRIVPFGESDNINQIIELNGLVYFSAFDETLGNELWVSNGTPEGTTVLKDIREGSEGSFPQDFIIKKNKIYFRAYTEEANFELWVTDGTPEGTVLLKDINEGPSSSIPSNIEYVISNTNLFFYADDGIHGSELWKTDGSTEGTKLVKDIREGPATSNFSNLVGGILNNKIYFLADDGTNGEEFWESDGTEEGTRQVSRFRSNANNVFLSKPYFTNSKFFFYANDGLGQIGLWIYDDTLKDFIFLNEIINGFQGIIIDHTGNGIYFSSSIANNLLLWKSDGTASGTVPVSEDVLITAFEKTKVVYGNKVYFRGRNEKNGSELWVSDGTASNTSLFKDTDKSDSSNPTSIIQIGDKVFYACLFEGRRRLCSYDIPMDTTTVIDVITEGRGTADVATFIEFQGELMFSGYSDAFGYEIWLSDGTVEGTRMIKDINLGEENGVGNNSNNTVLTKIGNRVYFSGNDGSNGGELWVTDGTEQGTYMIKDINLGSGGTLPQFAESGPNNFVQFNNQIYFSARDADGGGLFKTDGTNGGTEKIASLGISSISMVNNRLAITSGFSLWTSDGTSDGTFQIAQFNECSVGCGIKGTTVLNDELYLIATSPDSFREALYKSNGTAQGTILIFDAANQPIPSINIGDITTCGNYVYFGVKQSQSFDAPSYEIWRTDGTAEGTILVTTSESGFDSFYNLECLRDNLYFLDYSTQNNDNIWVTNGNPNEVYKLDFDIVNGVNLNESRGIEPMSAGNGKLFFSGLTDVSGRELYMATPSKVTPNNDLTDSDGDGVVDFFDECPDTDTGLEVDEVGCAENQLDDDNDGVTNDLDLCPETDEGLTVDQNGCAENQSPDDDNDGVFNIEDVCPNTPSGESVDESGCSQSQIDDDQDGVFNNLDVCPRTDLGVNVDESGCPVEFSLPSNNFQVMITGETCIDKNNGILSIIASNNEYTYSLNLEGSTYEFTEQLEIQNLEAKTYEFCITVLEEPDYEQCYVIDVPEAENITGKSTTLRTGKSLVETITINSGTAPFTAFINGNQVLSTSSSSFNLEVMPGDDIMVKSKFECEGSFNKAIELGNVSFAYPNPTNNFINLLMDTSSEEKLSVFIYDSNQRLLSNKEYLVNNGILQLSLTTYPNGIYFIRVKIGNEFKTFKIVKS